MSHGSRGLRCGRACDQRSRENDVRAERKCVCRVRAPRDRRPPIRTLQNRRIKPGAIRSSVLLSSDVTADFGEDHPAHWNGNHFVTVRRCDAGKLKNSFAVSACGESHKKFFDRAQNVNPLRSCREALTCASLRKRRQRGCDGSGFAGGGFPCREERRPPFIEHQSGIFDQTWSGKFGFQQAEK